MKSFAFLALPEDNDFWELEEGIFGQGCDKRNCDDGSTGLSVLGAGDLLVHRVNGDVLLYPSGRTPEHPLSQAPSKYSKFVYSTRFGFSVARSQLSLEEAAPDCMLAFVIGGDAKHDGVVLVRDDVEFYEISSDGRSMVSNWSPWPAIEVCTEIIPCEAGGHLRRHKIKSAVAYKAYDCGVAVPGDYHELTLEDVECVCQARAIGLYSGEPVLIKPEANTNIVHGKTLIPAVKYSIPVGCVELLTSIEVLS